MIMLQDCREVYPRTWRVCFKVRFFRLEQGVLQSKSRVKSVKTSVKRPFLPDPFNIVSDISELLSAFDDAPICVDSDLKIVDCVEWHFAIQHWIARKVLLLRFCKKGFICFRCDQVIKSCAARMDMLAARRKRDANKLRILEQKRKRNQHVLNVSFLFSTMIKLLGFYCFWII